MNDGSARAELNGVEYEGADLEALLVLHNYAQWIVDGFSLYLGERAVEFGAGLGAISQRLRPHVSSLDLVEPSPTLIDPLRRKFSGDGGVRIIHDTLEAESGRIEDGSRDSVVMVNVLEHIADDAEALRECHRILRPGGHLLIFVPALGMLYSELDRLVGHHRRYHRASLRQLARDAGFEIVRLDYFDMIGAFAWFLLNRVMGKTGFDRGLARFYDSVFVRLMRPVETLLPPPFGKNLILVARRPEAAGTKL